MSCWGINWCLFSVCSQLSPSSEGLAADAERGQTQTPGPAPRAGGSLAGTPGESDLVAGKAGNLSLSEGRLASERGA